MAKPSFTDALRFWLKLGFISFGGPAGQIAIMHKELVEKKRWIGEAKFLHALNFCMFLPGPEAQQLATYIGWLLHGIPGGLVAGALFVLPSAILLWGLSLIYVLYGQVEAVSHVLACLKPVVLAIVIAAVIRIGRKALRNYMLWLVAFAAYSALALAHVPFPLVILAAGLVGYVGSQHAREKFVFDLHGPGHGSPDSAPDDEAGRHSQSGHRPLFLAAAIIACWWIPIALLGVFLGFGHTIFLQGVFFSKAAMITFGGAYAVLPYVSEQAVETHGWLSASQMMDGLGLAETTPGPLIMVLQFVGFLGGWNQPQGLPPILAATLGAAVTTWATFLPSYLWIFAGAPYIERLQDNQRLKGTLTAITAAVVGVILNLALWFGAHVILSGPESSLDISSAVISVAAILAMVVLKIDAIPVIVASIVLGLIRAYLL